MRKHFNFTIKSLHLGDPDNFTPANSLDPVAPKIYLFRLCILKYNKLGIIFYLNIT